MTPHDTRYRRIVTCAVTVIMCFSVGGWSADSSYEHPLAPPDRTSPRATLQTFFDSINTAWSLYSAKDPAVREVFGRARGCIDLTDVPPLVADQVSAKAALLLKEVLDRIEMPAMEDIPDASEVSTQELTTWTVPYTEITLVQITEGKHKGEWLFSSETVDRVEEYYLKVKNLPYRPGRQGGHIEALQAGIEGSFVGRLIATLPASAKTNVNGMLVWQWAVLGLLIVLLVLVASAAAWLGRRWASSRLPGARLGAFIFPLTLLATPYMGRFFIQHLLLFAGEPTVRIRLAFAIIGYLGLAWLVAVLVNRLGGFVVDHSFRDARPLKKQLVRVMFRVAIIIFVTGVAVMALQTLGVPVAGLIAGVGVGGLAIALAAQSTLENFIGGIILYADQPVKVGDLCKFGNLRGIVEDVGLRSVKIRTLDRTIVTVPNADFAKLQLENLADRDRVLLRENLRLRYETPRAQLQDLMADLETMLREHERIADEPLRVRFNGFGEYFLEVELYAHAITKAWPEFLEIRENVLLKVMEIVEQSGTRLALPTGVRYVGELEAAEKPSDARAGVTTG